MNDNDKTCKAAPLVTPDGRYIVVGGVLWRRSDPTLPAARKKRLLSELGRARNAVKQAKREGDDTMLRQARKRVDRAKRALGERGPVWWDDGAPDLTGTPTERTSYGRNSG